MRRRIFIISVTLSAILLALALGMWIRTFVASDDARLGRWVAPNHLYLLHARWGGEFVHVEWSHTRFPMPHPWPNTFEWEYTSYPPGRQGLGSWVWWDHYLDQPSGGGAIEVWRVQVRPWLLAIPFIILPMIWAIRFVAHRRRWREGLCQRCGYDLRASPARCPECGAVPVSSTRAVAT